MHHELRFSGGVSRRGRAAGKLRSASEDDVAAVFDAAAELFAALSCPMRLSIVCHLRGQDMNVQQIANRIGSSQPNTSLHLRHLRQIGIVHRTREGRVVTYRIGNTFVANLCNTVCQDH